MFSKMFFVYLFKGEYALYGIIVRLEIILHLTDIKWWSYDAFDYTFNNLHDEVQ